MEALGSNRPVSKWQTAVEEATLPTSSWQTAVVEAKLPNCVESFEDRVELALHKSKMAVVGSSLPAGIENFEDDDMELELETHKPWQRSVSDPCVSPKLLRLLKPITYYKGSQVKPHIPARPLMTRREAIRHLAKYLLVALCFGILLCVPSLMGQPERETYLEALGPAGRATVTLSNHWGELLAVRIFAGECKPNAAASAVDTTSHSLSVHVLQDGVHVGRSRDVPLHTDAASASSSSHRRLGGGGGDLVHNGVKALIEFDISALADASLPVKFELETNCPSAVAVSLQLSALGIVGKGQVWIALVLLIGVLGLILTEVIHRTVAAFVGASCVLFVLALEHRLPTVSTIITWMDHGTLALLWGMMVIVALLSRTGVFEWCAVRLFEKSRGSMWKLYSMLMTFCAFSSAFLDNVTTVLLLCPVVISLCKAINIDPKPMLISLALFSTIGGSATMIGDPPNIIIGNAFSDEVSFLDFIVILGSCTLILMPASLVFARWYYGKHYFSTCIDVDVEKLKRDYPICEPRLLIQSLVVLSMCIFLFFLHPVTHLNPAYITCGGATLMLALCSHHDFEYALGKVEWDSLLFFAGLFVFTEGLAELGLLREAANGVVAVIESIPVKHRPVAASIILQIGSAVASAFVDNIPFTTTMIPVLQQTAATVEGLSLRPLIWALAFGADLGGMGTLIGASANIVMSGVAEEAGYHISFGEFFRIGFPMMCLVTLLSALYLVMLLLAGLLD